MRVSSQPLLSASTSLLPWSLIAKGAATVVASAMVIHGVLIPLWTELARLLA